jgi:hypothetical protein
VILVNEIAGQAVHNRHYDNDSEDTYRDRKHRKDCQFAALE